MCTRGAWCASRFSSHRSLTLVAVDPAADRVGAEVIEIEDITNGEPSCAWRANAASIHWKACA